MINEKTNRLRNFLEKLDVIRKKYEDIEAQKTSSMSSLQCLTHQMKSIYILNSFTRC